MSTKNANIEKRIAMLGEMNDRHILALDNCDRKALEELAIEYESISCPCTANMIRMEAKAIRRTARTAANGEGISDPASPRMVVTA